MPLFSRNSNKCYVSGCKGDGAFLITVRDLSKPEVQKSKLICRNCYRQQLCNGFSPTTAPGARPTPCSNKNVTDCFTSSDRFLQKKKSQQFYCASCADTYLRQTQLKPDLSSPGCVFTSPAGTQSTSGTLSRREPARPLSTCSHSSDFEDMNSTDMKLAILESKLAGAERREKTAQKKAEDAERRAENAENPSDRCVVCLEGNLEILILPCSHACLCQGCSSHFPHGSQCPVCRGRIEGRQRIFI